MEQYKQLIQTILDKGVEKTDRTGVGTLSVFGTQSHYDLNNGFPLLTLKKTYFKGIVHELLWFINGDTNIEYLVDNDVHIWDEWAYERYKKIQDEEAFKIGTFPVILDFKDYVKRIKADANFANKYGDLGPIYGKQWRQWQDWKDMPSGGRNEKFSLWHDQLATAIHTLKTNPEDRGIIVNAWNVSDLKQMALRPCHTMFQFYAIPLTERERNSHPIAQEARGPFRTMFTDKELDTLNVPKHKLSLQLYQRSADLMLGVPFNVASYALLLEMVAQQVNMSVGEFVHTCGDCHIYKNAIDAAHECLKREEFPLPKIKLNKKPSLFDYKYEDIELIDYKSHPAIKIEVAV